MRKTSAVVHAIFECRTCGMKWENYLTAQTLARQHAIKKRHRVEGETGTSIQYDATK